MLPTTAMRSSEAYSPEILGRELSAVLTTYEPPRLFHGLRR